MRAYIVSDIHFADNRENNLLSAKIIETVKKECVDIVIIPGDFFVERESQPYLVLKDVRDLLQKIAEICPVHIIPGNHDVIDHKKPEKTFLQFFKHLDNVFLYTEPTVWGDFYFIPHYDNRFFPTKIQEEYRDKIMICHQNFQNFGGEKTSFVDPEIVKNYSMVISGDLHNGFFRENVNNICSAWQKDYGENINKGYYILETSNKALSGPFELIEPKYINQEVSTADEAKNIPEGVRVVYTGSDINEFEKIKQLNRNVSAKNVTVAKQKISFEDESEFVASWLKENDSENLMIYYEN